MENFGGKLIFSSEESTWNLKREFWVQQKYFTEAELASRPCSSFTEQWQEIKSQGRCLIVGDSSASEVLAAFSSVPREIELLQSCDSVLRVQNRWWPRNFWSMALRESLVARAQQLDTHRVAYLTGTGGHAFASLVVLAQLGFKRIMWVVTKFGDNELQKQFFLKHFFGVSVEFIVGQGLTLQANNGSILINTLTYSSGVDFLQDLIYLNFLQKGGVVVETQLESLDSQLLIEAGSVGVHSVPAWYLEGARDYLLLQDLMSQDPTSQGEHLPEVGIYLEQWHNFLKTRPTLSQNK